MGKYNAKIDYDCCFANGQEGNWNKGVVMAIVHVSLDTETRQVVLTINNVLVSATDVNVSKYVYDDGEVGISFSYTIESVNSDGLLERRQFFLPHPSDVAVVGELDKDGFASKVVHNDEKAKSDTINYLKQCKDQ